MPEIAHILIVDDDPRVRDLLCGYLEDEGFRTSGAAGGEEMRACMARSDCHLVILDLTLPGEDGLFLARELRAASDVPIIIVTGKGDVIDRVTGLEVGADDYVTKPFELREILARIRAVLRRTRSAPPDGPGAAEAPEEGGRVMFEGWTIDLARRELRSPDGPAVPLTTGEFTLLRAFVEHPNRPLDRDRLMDLTRGRDWTPFDRSIDTQVARLRRKIETDPGNPAIIKTVRGVGYIFTPEIEKPGR